MNRDDKEDDLYIAVNSDGNIKIGRSGNIPIRLATLQAACGQPIRLVASLPLQGYLEREVHALLWKWHLIGEWFCGDEGCKLALAKYTGMDLQFGDGAYLSRFSKPKWARSPRRVKGQRVVRPPTADEATAAYLARPPRDRII